MKIGIDTQSIINKKTGLGIYTENLLKALFQMDLENEYVALHSKKPNDLTTPGRWIWDQVTLPRLAKKADLDLLHKPCFSAPIFYDGKIVLTVHDIIPVLFPENLSFSARMYWARWLPYTFKKADKIIAISESTKKDLIKYLHLPSEKITVIYEGSSFENLPNMICEADKKRVKNKYNLLEKYLLCVSTLEPKKNLPFLVRCFYLAKKKFNFSEKLVIVGKIGWGVGPFFEQIKKYNLEKEIILTGYVTDEDLPVLFKMASAFVSPSLYEGFGLPVLDALKSGCQVITSNSSSLPEIVGDAGILANPKREQEWVEELGALLSKKSLRENYKNLGIKQGEKFSWKKCAEQTLKVYSQAINEKKL